MTLPLPRNYRPARGVLTVVTEPAVTPPLAPRLHAHVWEAMRGRDEIPPSWRCLTCPTVTYARPAFTPEPEPAVSVARLRALVTDLHDHGDLSPRARLALEALSSVHA